MEPSMSEFEDWSFDTADFSGRVRVFPLPDLVMFPHVLQPLHVFEPRYRALFEAALADDRLIAMALLSPGWESDYDGCPPVEPFACLGRIATHQRLDDGRYNLLLQGVRRIKLTAELPPHSLFREAEAELCEDLYPTCGAQQRPQLRRQLLENFKILLPKLPEAHEQLDQLLSSEIPLGMLTDLVAYALDLGLEFKLRLLGEPDVDARARLLLERLAKPLVGPYSSAGKADGFPPDFSLN
jgi:ATP-dependent Lon protease